MCRSAMSDLDAELLEAVIHQVMLRKDAAVAHRMMEERRHFGKIVLEIA